MLEAIDVTREITGEQARVLLKHVAIMDGNGRWLTPTAHSGASSGHGGLEVRSARPVNWEYAIDRLRFQLKTGLDPLMKSTPS